MGGEPEWHNQKSRATAKFTIIFCVFFCLLEKQLEKETLKIICARSVAEPRQVRRYDRILVIKEVPAGRWGGRRPNGKSNPDSATELEPRSTRDTAGSSPAAVETGAPVKSRPGVQGSR